jgi:tRNA pseudouridine synthase 9
LGYPIANDPLYCTDVWGENLGKGGVTEEETPELIERIKNVTFPLADLVGAGATNDKDGGDAKANGQTEDKKEAGGFDQGQHKSGNGTDKEGTILQEPKEHSKAGPETNNAISNETPADGNTPSDLAPPPSELDLTDFPCPECALNRMDPIPDQLRIYLHSFKYNGEGWEYETGWPEWALEAYEGDQVLVDRFWKFGGQWDGFAAGEVIAQGD